MIDKILEKFFGYIDHVCEGIDGLIREKPKRKKIYNTILEMG